MSAMNLTGDAVTAFASRAAGAGLALLTHIVLANHLGDEEMGHFVFATSAMVLGGTVTTLGLGTAASRFVSAGITADDPSVIGAYIRWAFKISALVALGGAGIGAIFVVATTHAGSTERTTLLAALAFLPFFGVLQMRSGVAMSLRRVHLAMLPSNFVRPLAFLVVVAIAIGTGRNLNALQATLVQGAVVVVLAAGSAIALGQPGTRGQTKAQTWLGTSFPLLVTLIVASYMIDLNVFLAGLRLPAADVAVLNASLRIGALAMFFLVAVDSVAAPRLAAAAAALDLTALRSVISQAARLRFAGSIGFFFVVVVGGRPLLGLFGEGFSRGSTALTILAIAPIIDAANGPCARILAVSGHHLRALGAATASLVLLAVLYVTVIPAAGLVGAAVAVAFITAVQSVVLRRAVINVFGIDPSPLSRREPRISLKS